MKYLRIVLILSLISVIGCQENESNGSSATLDKIITEYQDHESYDKEEYPLGLYTKEYYKSIAEFAKSTLDKLEKIEADGLSETETISLDLLKFNLKDQIAYYEFEQYLNPLLSDYGFHSSLTYNVRPLTNYDDIKKYLNTLNAIPEYVNQHFVNLREGLEKGVSQPLVIFKGYESTYDSNIVDNYEDSYYYSPFKNLPKDLTNEQKDSVLNAARVAIEKSVTPEFKRIKKFFETEYFPKTRTSIGISETPNGEAFYQDRINFYTTSTQYTADDIHKIGLSEVVRIKGEMEKIIVDLEFKG
ncbi:MAG: hypothetical protein ACI89R_001350, partial [Candidatus Azotimanducaceae bacterium]